MLDVTGRRQAEEALRASEARFRRYFELGLIGMAVTSPTKGIVEVNDRVCEILGYAREELLQKAWADLTHPDDLAGEVTQFERVLAGEMDGYLLEKRCIRKDGQVIHTIVSVKCLRRADASVNYFIMLLEDITARKRAGSSARRSTTSTRSSTPRSTSTRSCGTPFPPRLGHWGVRRPRTL